MTLQEILPLFSGVHGSGKQYSARCPAHDDKHASLSISEGDGGRILFNCHAGCASDAVAAAVGLKMQDLFQTTPTQNAAYSPANAPVAVEYIYTDISGVPVAKKLRYPNKAFCWLHPDGAGGWEKGRGKIKPLPYNIAAVRDSKAVYIVEGEKDVNTLSRLNKPAVSLPDGAKSKWVPEYGELFTGKHVAIIPDNDEPGRSYAQTIAKELHGKAANVKVLDLSKLWAEIPEHGDITDYVETHPGTDLHELAELVSNTAEQTEQRENRKALQMISAYDLGKADLPPVQFLVDGFLPEGTAMISAPPKIGKSWFVLDLGLSIASGMPFLDRTTNRAGVMYLALEDSENRLQDRMNKILGGAIPPKNLHYVTKAPNLDNGLLDELDETLKQHPDIKLIIVDTLQKIRGRAQGRESAYDQDYREMGALKEFMDNHGVSVLFVHHTRKMKDPDDPFNMISGTQGIMGAADTAFTLLKAKREDEEATLSVTGRDVEQTSEILRFDKSVWRWVSVGDANQINVQQKREEFKQSPLARAVLQLIEGSPNKRWDGTATELLNEGERITGAPIAATARKLGWTLKNSQRNFLDIVGVIMETTTNGNAGKVYHFYKIATEHITLQYGFLLDEQEPEHVEAATVV